MNRSDNPRKKYQTPANIVSDKGLDHDTKLELLESWQSDLQHMMDSEWSKDDTTSDKREESLADEMLLVSKAIETLRDKANS
ncbi:hypothetical protein [Parasphingorhabdus sp.]|uniref:hypothetical protein n=1 Tax=Parasphingorhabdus sp. TaxID=2709688 RepID=UPI002F921DBA